MKRLFEALHFLAFTYPMGVALGALVWYLRWRGLIRLVHPECFPRWQRGVILVSNHPSLLEPIILPVLFLRQFLLHPFLFSPWSTPDLNNFGGFWWWWMRPRVVFIPRGDVRAQMRSLRRLRRILEDGGIVVMFPEGGRTSSAGGNGTVLQSTNGKRLRELKQGLAYLAQTTQALVVPVWVDGTDAVLPNDPDRKVLYHRVPKFLGHTVVIRVGSGLRFSRRDRKEEITSDVATSLLRLADETSV